MRRRNNPVWPIVPLLRRVPSHFGRLHVEIGDLLLQNELLVFCVALLIPSEEEILLRIGVGIMHIVTLQFPNNRVRRQGGEGVLSLDRCGGNNLESRCAKQSLGINPLRALHGSTPGQDKRHQW